MNTFLNLVELAALVITVAAAFLLLCAYLTYLIA